VIQATAIDSTTNPVAITMDTVAPVTSSGERISLRQRLGNFLHSQRSGEMTSGPVVTTSEEGTPGFISMGTEPPLLDQPSPAPKPTELRTTYRSQVGASEDYSWITGQLFFIHAGGGMWVVRYRSIGEEDRYGGSVVLIGSVGMKNFREGDLVSVHGEVLNGGKPSHYLGAPVYRANAVDMIERSDP
jgi:hypothetical protein